MILLDLSAVLYFKALKMDISDYKGLNKLFTREYKRYERQFGKKYGKPVVCSDCSPYWRHEIFPNYKKNRKKPTDFDVDTYKQSYKKIVETIATKTNIIAINVMGLEADDGLFLLSDVVVDGFENMLVTEDKDLIQTKKYCGKDIPIFAPRRKIFITDTDYSLYSHIVRGDASDGIPNIKSDTDTYVTDGKRSKVISKKRLNESKLKKDLKIIHNDESIYSRFLLNHTLIDMRNIPTEYKKKLRVAFGEQLNMYHDVRLIQTTKFFLR